VLGAHALEGLEPAEARHGDVEDHDVRAMDFDLLEDLTAVGGFSTQLDVALALDQTADTLPNYAVIVCDQYGNHLSRLHLFTGLNHRSIVRRALGTVRRFRKLRLRVA